MAGKSRKRSSSNTKKLRNIKSKKTSSRKTENKRQAGENEGFFSENRSELIFILISVVSIVLLLSNFHLV